MIDTTIKDIAQELATKNLYIRNETKKMMEAWASISDCGERIIAKNTIACVVSNKGFVDHSFKYHLHTGEDEIMAWDSILGEYRAPANDNYFWTVLPMPELRTFLLNFSKMVEEIKEEMEKKLINTEKIIELLDKMNGSQDD